MTMLSYDTVEHLSDVIPRSIPCNFVGVDGCSTTISNFTVSGSYGPASTRVMYEPEHVQFWKAANQQRRRPKFGPVPPITPYWVGTRKKRTLLIRRNYVTRLEEMYLQHGHKGKVNGSCTFILDSMDRWTERVSYNKVTHLHDYPGYVENAFDESVIGDVITQVTNDASVEALMSYDALSEAYESQEIPALVVSVCSDLNKIYESLIRKHSLSDLKQAFKIRPRRLLRSGKRLLRKIGDEWMQYRYAIKPLVYSYSDVMKNAQKSYDYIVRKSGSAMPVPNPNFNPASMVNSHYNFTRDEGTVQIRATVWQHFSSEEMAHWSGISINPVVTAWEEIPMSFVADWFVNVGDYLVRKTALTLADRMVACCSRRDKYIRRTYAHYPAESYGVSHSISRSQPFIGTLPTAEYLPNVTIPATDYPFIEEEVDSYSRWLFSVRDARLAIRPSLNWKRTVDGALISCNQLRKLVKYLAS